MQKEKILEELCAAGDHSGDRSECGAGAMPSEAEDRAGAKMLKMNQAKMWRFRVW